MSFTEQERFEGQLLSFLRNQCYLHPKSRVQHKDLYDSFDRHRTCNGTYPEMHVGRNAFSSAMKKVSPQVGVWYCRDSAGMFYRGLELRTDDLPPGEREALLREQREVRDKNYQSAYYQQNKLVLNADKMAKRLIYKTVLRAGLPEVWLETLRKYKIFTIIYRVPKESIDWSRGNINLLLHEYVDVGATLQTNIAAYSRLQGESMLSASVLAENERAMSALFRSVALSTAQVQPRTPRLKILTDQPAVVTSLTELLNEPHITPTLVPLAINPTQTMIAKYYSGGPEKTITDTEPNTPERIFPKERIIDRINDMLTSGRKDITRVILPCHVSET